MNPFRYVSLSDNEKTQFKARELKSVHVDAVGRYVKFVIHTNFINKHNHYNQVIKHWEIDCFTHLSGWHCRRECHR